jgi:hypothetical protein
VGLYRNAQWGFACLALLKIALLFIGINDHNVGIVFYREGTNTGKQRMNTINAMQQYDA